MCNEKHICEYGCGQEAKHQMNNGKWCCSKSHNSCPAIRKKNSKALKAIKGEFICEYCNEEFSQPHLLASHVSNVHSTINCKYCDKEIGSGNIKSHERCCPQNPNNAKYCKECGEQLTGKYQKDFCDNSCAAIYNHRKRKESGYSTKGKTEERECPKCGELKEFSIHAQKDAICDGCKEQRKRKRKANKTCNWCGRKKGCHQENKVCSWLCNAGTKIFRKLGGDIDKIGTNDIFNEVDRVIGNLHDEYNNGLSSIQLKEKYHLQQHNTILWLFDKFNLQKRSLSEATLNAYKTERLEYNPPTNTDYKSGHHMTWFGEEVFLRSSYEFHYAKQLDEQKVRYEYESLRIPYTWKGQEHIYVPDFYVPEQNLVIEIKGEWFYEKDQDRIEAKLESCKQQGYDTELITDKETEISFDI